MNFSIYFWSYKGKKKKFNMDMPKQYLIENTVNRKKKKKEKKEGKND